MNADSVRQIGVNTSSYNSNSAGHVKAQPKVEEETLSQGMDITDGFQSSKDLGLTEDGKARFILSFDDAHAADSLRDTWSKAKPNADAPKVVDNYPLVNGFAVEVDPQGVSGLLKSLPMGSKVAMDRPLTFQSPKIGLGNELTSGAKAGDPPPTDITNALIGIDKVWEKGFTGKGQTIAIIDSGIYPHPDLKDKIVAWVDVKDGKTQPYDSFGHGTHVAGIAAGSGVKSAGEHKGVAPEANLVGVRIQNVSEAIKGIQWVIENKEKYDIGVINMSLGDFAARSYKDDPWAQAAEKAMEAGLVVCVAAGNDGPSEHNISTPGIHPEVITVGALDDKRTMDRSDDQVAEFSSRGPTNVDGINKPDLVAPGVSIFGPLSPGAEMDTPELPHDGQDYVAISGTSMATPMVAGLSAVLLQANPKLDHKAIKEILVKSCDDYLGEEKNIQGAGVINAEKALELALKWEAPEGQASVQKASIKPADEGFLMA